MSDPRPDTEPQRTLDCIEKCEVPEGVELAEVPVPRHAWGDVFVCPNDGCGRAWLHVNREARRG